MQRAQIEFIKKRLGLLEKGLIAECQKEYFVSALRSMVHNFYFLLKFFLFGIPGYKPKMLVDHVIFVLEDMLSIKEASLLLKFFLFVNAISRVVV